MYFYIVAFSENIFKAILKIKMRGRAPKHLRKPWGIKKKPPPTEIVMREEWGAKPPLSREPFQLPAFNIMVKLYTDTHPCDTKEECKEACREIQQKYVEEQGLPDIPYNFLIGGDGRIYEGRGWFTASDKVRDGKSDWDDVQFDLPEWDKVSLDIAYIGHRSPDKKNITNPACELLEMGIFKKCIVGLFNIKILHGCPDPHPYIKYEYEPETHRWPLIDWEYDR